MAHQATIGARVTANVILGNLAGAVLTFLYFRLLDPSAYEDAGRLGPSELLFFVFGFALIVAVGHLSSGRWARPVLRFSGTPPSGSDGDELRRRALFIPGFFALLSFASWMLASLVWGVLWPLLTDSFAPGRALRQIFGILFVSGTTVTAIVFFRIERLWREELPRFFPDGILSSIRAPRLRVRTRMLAVFLLMSLLPLAVLAVAALTRARALLAADPATAEEIIRNLILVVSLLAAAGLFVSLRLATLLAARSSPGACLWPERCAKSRSCSPTCATSRRGLNRRRHPKWSPT